MSNRNEDRLGAVNQGEFTPVATEPSSTPQVEKQEEPTGAFSFDFSMPTEFVELPSKGVYYPKDHPLHGKTVVEIKHMTTKEEDILNSQTLIKQGIVFDRLLSSIVQDKSVNVESLLIADKNALLVATRRLNYGELYQPTVSCPKCNTPGEQNFDLSECGGVALEEDITEDLELDVKSTEQGTFIIQKLPTTKWDVEVKPITGKEEKKYLKYIENRKKANLNEGVLSSQMLQYIVSINGVAEKSTIARAIEVMPAKDSKVLRNVYKKIIPSYNMQVSFECSSCGHEERMDMPLTAEFFWSKR